LGHKVHPIGFRLGIIKGWQSRWFAERNYKDVLAEDLRVRALVQRRLANAAISRIEIERAAANQLSVTIHTAKPGIVIGKSGQAVEELRRLLEQETKKKVRLNIVEIRQPEIDAYLVAQNVAEQLEKRISFRRAMKQAVQKAMRAGAKGIRIAVSGRLGGAEIARTEKEMEGKIPLQTLRADIDYGFAEALTTYGVIGVKVWVYRGDVLPDRRPIEPVSEAQEIPPGQPSATAPEQRPRPTRPRRASGRGSERPAAARAPGERVEHSAGERGRSRQSKGEPGEREDQPSSEQEARSPTARGERSGRGGERSQRPTDSARPAGSGRSSRATRERDQTPASQAATEVPVSPSAGESEIPVPPQQPADTATLSASAPAPEVFDAMSQPPVAGETTKAEEEEE
jgi:small subunit ribosomal protein S3